MSPKSKQASTHNEPPRPDPREYIKFMLDHFKFERFFYLGATVISLGLLVYCAAILLKDGKEDKPAFKSALALLAPTGLITGACFRILKIWNDCFKVIAGYLNQHQNPQEDDEANEQ
ncbi:hypothetical protein LX64_00277 [Chitinophaga skermanii]|uniref:Uncharacterized protein n=1 Tax=Chitinophaga skermanii TaxID=331697 RepID=A0A327R202_9BACT|nr:hypothetical protein [Chitinophaga skermanii]RAJ10671.1 hypothetical protein LX64_00277 [Chitinophaga skermanii]